MKNVKETLTFRLSPELKAELQEEANKRDTTISSYVESVLLSRPLNEQGDNTTLQDLREKVLRLDTENETLRLQSESCNKQYVPETEHIEKITALVQDSKTLRQRNHQLEQHIKDLVQQRDSMAKLTIQTNPVWLSDGGNQQTTMYLKKLKSRYPAASYEQIWLAALVIAERNNRKFFMENLDDYFEKNSHLLIAKTN